MEWKHDKNQKGTDRRTTDDVYYSIDVLWCCRPFLLIQVYYVVAAAHKQQKPFGECQSQSIAQRFGGPPHAAVLRNSRLQCLAPTVLCWLSGLIILICNNSSLYYILYRSSPCLQITDRLLDSPFTKKQWRTSQYDYNEYITIKYRTVLVLHDVSKSRSSKNLGSCQVPFL